MYISDSRIDAATMLRMAIRSEIDWQAIKRPDQ